MVGLFTGPYRDRFRAVVALSAVFCIGVTSVAVRAAGSDRRELLVSDMIDQELHRVLGAGRNVLLVELYGTTTYVFDATHEVAGPVLRVLRRFDFEPVLPEGVTIASDGLLPLAVEAMTSAPADHVFLMNFSRDEAFVGRLMERLGALADGRVYRLDSTAAEAFSSDWREDFLAPKVRAAIVSGAGGE